MGNAKFKILLLHFSSHSAKLYDNIKIFWQLEVEISRNKMPMGLDALLENQLGHLQKFHKLHIYPLSTLMGRN